ncbi:HAD family hydrolase [Candidatus Binatus sp.]|uniref:HAD family hydrolase n=1 Tax=Candidatus Binatus sp. TaxID=2811406 RepID=UPI003CC61961
MAEHRYKAVVIDLFDTLVTWNPEGLPLMQFRGREIRSTTPLLYSTLETALGKDFDREKFSEAHASVYSDIFSERARADALEITCLERFARTLKILNVDESIAAPLAEDLRRIHMARVREVTKAPPARIDAMKKIANSHRLGLISNFDDSETGHQIMRDTGIRELFTSVIISADTGYRKPNPLIFKKLLDAMRLEPADILFVGDTPLDDVLGSKGVGMHSAWIRTRNRELPDKIPAPDIIIQDLAELPAALGL